MFPEGRIFEFLIVGAIALIVVGPKDLPVLMRRAGLFVAKMRAMAAEFRASFDEIARQSELDDLRREVESLRSGEPLKAAVGLGKDSEAHQVFDEIHSGLKESEASAHTPMGFMAPLPTVSAPTPPMDEAHTPETPA